MDTHVLGVDYFLTWDESLDRKYPPDPARLSSRCRDPFLDRPDVAFRLIGSPMAWYAHGHLVDGLGDGSSHYF